jgi:hypothetical protein
MDAYGPDSQSAILTLFQHIFLEDGKGAFVKVLYWYPNQRRQGVFTTFTTRLQTSDHLSQSQS